MSTVIKISDLKVGQQLSLPLLILSATARETRMKKPYLQLQLSDGAETIQGNYWDWLSGKVPEKNTVLEIHCQVGEYQGAKQLTINKMLDCISHTAADFVPKIDVDMQKVFDDAKAFVTTMCDPDLQMLVNACFDKLQALWLEIPAAKTMHHNFIGGTLVHCVETCSFAEALALRCPVNTAIDLVVAGALLHDLGKLFTYKFDGAIIEMTNDGQLLDHSFIGANFVDNFAESIYKEITPKLEMKLKLLKHCIISHHGKLEYGAAVTPKCIEAAIIHAADGLSTTSEYYRVACKDLQDTDMWTDRVYGINNLPVVSPKFTVKLFEEIE